VPVHVDPRTGRIDVAAAEPLDWHLGHEFGFHFGQPIRVLQASPESVRVALDRLQQATKVSVVPPRAERVHSDAPIPLVGGQPGTAPLPSDAPIPLVRAEPAVRSDAPIPLVRRSLAPAAARAPSVVPPGSVRPSAPHPTALSAAEGAAASWRAKPPPVDLIEGAARLESDARAVDRKPTPVAPAPAAHELLEAATTPEHVLAVLRDCLAPVHSIVFTVKNASFDGRVASVGVEQRTKARQLSLLSHQPSVLETAVKSGFYLGPIPNTPNHRELREALSPDSTNEVYATVITVSDRPSLVWLLGGFEQSLDLTRRADEIALAAGRALGRILRQRKRGS
jgi:hypothetical protein